VEELNNIQSGISTILGEELQRVKINVFCKYKKWIRSGRGQNV
jgi:hypothetical protein